VVLQEAVADALEVKAKDVDIVGIESLPKGADGVTITYTVSNLDSDEVKTAEKTLESATLAQSVESELKDAGFSVDVAKADAEASVVVAAADDDAPSEAEVLQVRDARPAESCLVRETPLLILRI
jgi:hypothetical protein